MPPKRKRRQTSQKAQLLFHQQPVEGPRHLYRSPQLPITHTRQVPSKPIDHNTITSWVGHGILTLTYSVRLLKILILLLLEPRPSKNKIHGSVMRQYTFSVWSAIFSAISSFLISNWTQKLQPRLVGIVVSVSFLPPPPLPHIPLKELSIKISLSSSWVRKSR